MHVHLLEVDLKKKIYDIELKAWNVLIHVVCI